MDGGAGWAAIYGVAQSWTRLKRLSRAAANCSKMLSSRPTIKVTGGDGIPAELFQILKDGAVKVLHSICQQIWKTQQWPHD